MREKKQVSERAKQVAADYLYLTNECGILTNQALGIMSFVHARDYTLRRGESTPGLTHEYDSPHGDSPPSESRPIEGEEDLKLVHSL